MGESHYERWLNFVSIGSKRIYMVVDQDPISVTMSKNALTRSNFIFPYIIIQKVSLH